MRMQCLPCEKVIACVDPAEGQTDNTVDQQWGNASACEKVIASACTGDQSAREKAIDSPHEKAIASPWKRWIATVDPERGD